MYFLEGSEKFPFGVSIFGKDCFCDYEIGFTDWPCVCFSFKNNFFLLMIKIS